MKNQAGGDDRYQNGRTGNGVNHQPGGNVFDFSDSFFSHFPRLEFLSFGVRVGIEIVGDQWLLIERRRWRRGRDVNFLQRRKFRHLRKADAVASGCRRFGHHGIDSQFWMSGFGRFEACLSRPDLLNRKGFQQRFIQNGGGDGRLGGGLGDRRLCSDYGRRIRLRTGAIGTSLNINVLVGTRQRFGSPHYR